MKLHRFKKSSHFIFLTFLIIFLLFTLGVWAEDSPLKEKVRKYVQLQGDFQIRRLKNGADQIVLWQKSSELRGVEAWGLVHFLNDEPIDSWRYSGMLVNDIQQFHPTFHQFTQDGRLELAIVGTGKNSPDWTYFFIFNLTDKGMQILTESANNARGALTFLEEDQIYNQGMFLDLNDDGIDELIVYKEIRGSLPEGPCWPNIFSWNEGQFVLSNENYPDIYIPFFQAFQEAAKEEEKLPMGKHRILYEYQAKIYDIWGEEKAAEEVRSWALLPPLEMGKRLKALLKDKGLRPYQVIQGDLDGEGPKDTVVWALGIEGLRNNIWVISQANGETTEPIEIPLSGEFFEPKIRIDVALQPHLITISRRATKEEPRLSYTFRYNQGEIELVGREELHYLADGRVICKNAGDESVPLPTEPEEIRFQMPLIQAEKMKGTARIDGIFSEKVWSEAKPVFIGQEEDFLCGQDFWQGMEDLSYTLNAATKGDSLFLGVKVTDESRVYAQKSGLNQNPGLDHIEIWFEEFGQLYHYGIFILPMQTQIIQWVGDDAVEPYHTIRAQWMPSKEGYWMEIEIQDLDFTEEVYPLTLTVVDGDNSEQIDPMKISTLSSSPFRMEERYSLGQIKIH